MWVLKSMKALMFFQLFLKIKMQNEYIHTVGGVGNEDMIEESINASKCYMLEKINEWICLPT